MRPETGFLHFSGAAGQGVVHEPLRNGGAFGESRASAMSATT